MLVLFVHHLGSHKAPPPLLEPATVVAPPPLLEPAPPPLLEPLLEPPEDVEPPPDVGPLGKGSSGEDSIALILRPPFPTVVAIPAPAWVVGSVVGASVVAASVVGAALLGAPRCSAVFV